MTTIDLEVQGMSCGSCVAHVKKALQPLAGVRDVSVDLTAGQVRVAGDLGAGAAPIVAALAAAGYPAREIASTPGTQAHPQTTRGCCR